MSSYVAAVYHDRKVPLTRPLIDVRDNIVKHTISHFKGEIARDMGAACFKTEYNLLA